MYLRKSFAALSSVATPLLTIGSRAWAASPTPNPATASPFMSGQPLAPWVLVFGFTLLVQARWLMDPGRMSKKATGTVAAVGGTVVLVNGYLIMNNPSILGGLAPASNFITAFTVVYGFFFTALGFIQMQTLLNSNVLGPLATLIAFFTLAAALVFFSAGALYHALILAMVFIAFGLAGLVMAGKVTFNALGWWMSITSLMLVITGFLWSLAPFLQGAP